MSYGLEEAPPTLQSYSASGTGWASRATGREQDQYLLVECDDLGLCESVNKATLDALLKGHATSASIMPVCPYFSETAELVRAHPHLDLGVHLTLTCEWPNYRWGPVAARADVPSLVGPDGCFWKSTRELANSASVEEVVLELSLQVERCLSAGIQATHINTHMMALLTNRYLLEAYIAIAERYRMPLLVPNEDRIPADLVPLARPHLLGIQSYIAASPTWNPARWHKHYLHALHAMKPGINVLAVHLGYDASDMARIGHGSPFSGWDGPWRQRDAAWVISSDFEAYLKESGVQLIGWRGAARLLL